MAVKVIGQDRHLPRVVIVMQRIAAEGPRIVLEVGPGKVLTGLARRAFPEVTFVPVGTREDLAGVLEKIEAAS